MSKKIKALFITIAIISIWLLMAAMIYYYPDVLEKIFLVIIIVVPVIMIPILIYSEVLKELE